MRRFHFAIALTLLLAALAEPLAAQSNAQKFANSDGQVSWWDRITNKYSWLRTQLGRNYVFERSIGVIIAVDDYSGSSDFKDLASPTNDAERVRKFLIDEAGF